MKTLYLECNMGAGGKTIASALLELMDNPQDVLDKINAICGKDLKLISKKSESSGVRGTALYLSSKSSSKNEDEESVQEEEVHEEKIPRKHRVLKDMLDIIDDMPINARVRKNAVGIATLIAESVAATRGTTKEEAHLHGHASIENIIMIVTICLIIDELEPEYIAASPVCLGMGYTHSIYGTVAVPTPVTSYLLTGIPSFAGKFEGELCTTLGAAVLKWFVKEFENMPKMVVKKIGCGIGKEKFTAPNCLRAFWGEIISTGANSETTALECIVDDMTAEAISFVQNRLSEQGADEVYTSAIQMSQSRHGIKLTCICDNQVADDLAVIMLRLTTATSVRRTSYMTYSMKPVTETKQTKYGDVKVKTYSGYGIDRIKPVYKDIEEIAIKNNMPINDAYAKVIEEIK